MKGIKMNDVYEDKWYRFEAYNTEAQYGWGTESDAKAYCDYINRDRDIVNCYSYFECNSEQVVWLNDDDNNEGFDLYETLVIKRGYF
jgi:hypothetical protein